METPDNAAPRDDSAESELIDQMVAEAVDYIYGKELDNVVEVLTNTDDTAGSIGSIAYKTTTGLFDKHKKQGMSLDVEMDTAMGVNTEVIDMLLEILGKVQKTPVNEQRIREDALLHTVMMHAETLADDPAAQEDASVILRGMMQDGTTDEAFDYVNNRAQQDGININDMVRQGDELAKTAAAGTGAKMAMADNGPQKTPVAAGVERGLMGGM